MSQAPDSTTELLDEIARLKARLREMEQRLAERQHAWETLRADPDAIGQLAASVAHDFNNLITVIRGHATQACASLLPDHEARKALRSILDATQHTSDLTRSLQAFVRKVPIEKRPVDLRRVVEDAARLVQPILPATIALEIENDHALPVWVEADASQLHQVVLNLAINARDAMAGGGRLGIAVRVSRRRPERRRPGGEALLVVTDTGIGIAPENLCRIFEPFFTTKSRECSSGLGLSIVQRIVGEHGGRVEVDSTPGKGTAFTVSLPLTQSRPCAEPVDEVPVMPRGNGELILLAESNPHLGGIIALTLESLGYAVMQATDGVLIPQIARKQGERLRLVIIEADLPGCRGITCLERMREEGLRPPAILLTGRSEPQASDVPVGTTLLSRPFEMPQLARMVYDAVRPDRQKETGP